MEIFDQPEQDKIVQQISLAEGKTSGEIRLVVERKTKDKPAYERAKEYFEKLDMHKTTLRNGILIYMAVEDHQFAVIGDAGIHSKVDVGFWELVKEHMVVHFQEGNLVKGLCEGIREVGEQLQHYFPRQDNDVNELPDDIHFGTN